MKYAWIDGQHKDFGLGEMCSVLDVSISGYRAWKRGGKPERKRLTDTRMLLLIQAIHAEFKGIYGRQSEDGQGIARSRVSSIQGTG